MAKFPANRHLRSAPEQEAAVAAEANVAGKAPAPAFRKASVACQAPVSCEASTDGIAQCLRMLADEAASLGLAGTVSALRMAIAICEHEAAQAPRGFAAREPIQPPVPSSVN